jgi:hypothetical protein
MSDSKNVSVQSPVYIKNKARAPLSAQKVVPEHVRLEVNAAECKSFEDDFRSAAAIKGRQNTVKASDEIESFEVPAVIGHPIVGHFDGALLDGAFLGGERVKDGDPNESDISSEDVPARPIRHRRFLVAEGAEKQVSDDPEQEELLTPIDIPKQTNITVDEQFNMNIGDFGIFMGNNYICTCKDQEEAEQAVEIILTTDPPEEIIVVKRVAIKIGVNIIG